MTDIEALVVSEARTWRPMYLNIYETAEPAWGLQGETPDWNAFVEMLRETSQDPIVGPDKEACKDASTAFCPAGSFTNDGRRKKVNAQRSWFITVDAEEGPTGYRQWLRQLQEVQRVGKGVGKVLREGPAGPGEMRYEAARF